MQPIWRLATNSLAGRPGRTALLIAAVAAATALVVAAGVCIDTLGASVFGVVGRVTGHAELRISHAYNEPFDAALLDKVNTWPQVRRATGTYEVGVTIKNIRTGDAHIVKARGIDPQPWGALNPKTFIEGNLPQTTGEVAMGQPTADHINAKLGEDIMVLSLGREIPLKLVGIFERPKLDVLQSRLILVTRPQVEAMSDETGKLHEILVQLRDPAQVKAVQAEYNPALPQGVRLNTTAGAAAEVGRALRSIKLALLIVTVLIYLAAAFIILTSLGINVIERLGELAVLRCIGASRTQIAAAQLLAGVMLAVIGGAVGILPGLGGAWWFYQRHSDVLVAGFYVDPHTLLTALAACAAAGLAGGAYPAALAATRPPLQGLTARAATTSRRAIAIVTVIGLACVAFPLVLHATVDDVQRVFWVYITAGLPLLFAGFFLLTAPLALLVGKLLAPPLAVILRVPVDLLRQQFIATPFRNGFAGGALMVGVAMLVAVWTIGPSLMTGWLDNIRMPDGFAHSFFSLSERKWKALQNVDAVTDLCPVTAFPVTVDGASFGVESVSPPATLFVSCDIDAFVRMVDLEWIEGDPEAALQGAQRGKTLVVSREYRIAHDVGVGDQLTLMAPGGPVTFDVVGVVASKGLDVATHTFGIQQAYEQAAVSSVFGTQRDAERFFGVKSINLVLMDFKDDVSDEAALDQVREAAPGVIVGSSRRIVRGIRRSIDRLLRAISVLAMAILGITCLGVTNLIAAMLAAQRYELGVMRAVGASRGMLARSVIAQTLLLAMVGALAGAALGYELAWVNQLFHRRLMGITYTPRLPIDVTLWGAAAAAGGALLAATPPLVALMRKRVREMIA